ncbi:MAG: hypothetical protein ACUVWN_10685, partial [bacterium]
MEFLIPIILFSVLEPADKEISAQNDIPDNEPVGQRPYEMLWADRREEQSPLVDFEDLSGWKVLLYNGASASFSRSREQQMWGQYVSKLAYKGTSQQSKLIISPQSPINIPEPFDCINLWCYGNNWGWVPDPSTPQVNLAVHLNDSQGISHRIPLTNVRWKEWWLIHKRIEQEIKFPCQFIGLEVSGISNTEDRILYFDSLVFYNEELKPLKFEPRPARNIKPFPGQTHGLNGTGEGVLPFPNREETILPENYERNFENSIIEKEKGVFEFHYKANDTNLCYRYQPKKGNLGEFTVEVNGQIIARPMADGGVKFIQELGDGKLESAIIDGKKLIVT